MAQRRMAKITDPSSRPCWQKRSLQWSHTGRDSVSNHQPHDCLLNRLFRCRSKKTSKLCVTGLCAGNSSGTGEFPAQMASYAGNVSIWWRHHVIGIVNLITNITHENLGVLKMRLSSLYQSIGVANHIQTALPDPAWTQGCYRVPHKPPVQLGYLVAVVYIS